MSDAQPAAERQATFAELFGLGEYRAVFTATLLSWTGDYLAKAAVMALVFQQTESVLLSAAAFGMTYLPWVVGGPLLAALAERYRYRGVMILCDVLRAALIALVALPGAPIWAMLCLLFAVALLNPPAQAARSATMPLILTGDRLVLGIAVNQSSAQVAQVVGYMAGAVIAAFNPRLALLINAGTFLVSALILWAGLRDRPPAMLVEHRSHLLRETAEGFRVVFGTPVLRAIALLVFAAMLFTIVPEGLAIGWAHELAASDGTRRGFYQGLIMVANPVGFILGGLLIARLVQPALRRRLVRVFAVAAPLALVPSLTNPGVVGVVAMALVCGFAVSGMIPVLNALFVQALPNGFRARAFGVMNAGMQVTQGTAIFITGALAHVFSLYLVVGLWSLAGVALMLMAASKWPRPQAFTDAITTAATANAARSAAGAGAMDQPTTPAEPATRSADPVDGVPAPDAVADAPRPAAWRRATSRGR